MICPRSTDSHQQRGDSRPGTRACMGPSLLHYALLPPSFSSRLHQAAVELEVELHIEQSGSSWAQGNLCSGELFTCVYSLNMIIKREQTTQNMKTKNEGHLLSYENKTTKCPTSGYSTSYTHRAIVTEQPENQLSFPPQSLGTAVSGEGVGCHSRGGSRNDTAHPRSGRPSSAALTKTKSPLEGNPIQILFAREEKVKETNPQEDLKFQLAMPLQRTSSRELQTSPSLPPPLGNSCLPGTRTSGAPEHQHCSSHGTPGRSRATR